MDGNIIQVEKITNGPAESCYLAKNKINENEPLFISSCDYLTIFNEKKWEEIIKNKKIDGAIWTFKLQSLIVKSYDAFGYCKVYNKKFVKEIVEKETISSNPKFDHMMLGSFWFRKAKSFFESFEEAKKKKFMVL